MASEGGQIAYPNFSVYHATKWGIEGFVEAVAQEVAPFQIACTIVEPGPTATGFGAALVSPPPMADYDATPAGEMRRAIAHRTLARTGDPLKMVRTMIASVDRAPAPKRLTLGSTAYSSIPCRMSPATRTCSTRPCASVASSRRHIVATLTPQNVARSSMRRRGHRSSQCKSSQSIMPAA